MADPGAPSVSVVIPVKDDAVLLERCLAALVDQTVAPLEVVVVDNGSVDRSGEVAARYGARVVREAAPGIPAAAATGYDAALGDVIARCDADTVPPPDWISRLLLGLRPGVAAVTGPGRFYDLPPGIRLLARWGYLTTYFVSVHAALGHSTLWGSNMAFRRSSWLEVRGGVHRSDPELHDDIDLAFALGPGRAIRHVRSLQVGVSARCLHGRGQLRRRMRRATRTLRVNWAQQPPWERWRASVAARHMG
ncbi:MAG TPA: glycosyltransferase family 2 protein [Marmoricola sp.]|nr:glycosyltransferase family 2 protein [Marmoricola sp.]